MTQQISVLHMTQQIQSQPSFFWTMMSHCGHFMASPFCSSLYRENIHTFTFNKKRKIKKATLLIHFNTSASVVLNVGSLGNSLGAITQSFPAGPLMKWPPRPFKCKFMFGVYKCSIAEAITVTCLSIDCSLAFGLLIH